MGDLHTHWDDVDNWQFASAPYDLLFFAGDLGGGLADSTLRVARSISRLRQPTLVMPGNNDTVDVEELAAELALQGGFNKILAITRDNATESDIRLCGYSLHELRACGLAVDIIAGRPHSMGGPQLSFPDYMAATYAVHSLEDSARRLCELVDAAEAEALVFMAHNGPTGLGDEPGAIWGCDFKPGGGDWGDPDLEEAIAYARSRGKRVLAVVAGHMHLRTRDGEERPWLVDRDGTLYVNSARVPRIFAGDDDTLRHHLEMRIEAGGVSFRELLVPESGAI
ncbi:hypothetical protein [Haliea sp. E17]|uniref:hypothetical protein n=1 Tax=Haliea sp. E17 TaxID=3401576 RepID=UPI003AAE8FF0